MAGNKLGHNGYDFYNTTDNDTRYVLILDKETKVEGTPKQLIRQLLNLI